MDYWEEAKRITRDHQDEFFWRDAHATLVSLQNLLAAQNALGLLTNFTETALRAAKAQLDKEFATHAKPEDDDIPF